MTANMSCDYFSVLNTGLSLLRTLASQPRVLIQRYTGEPK